MSESKDLKIFHKSFQKGHKMFGLSDVTWNSFLEEVIRKNFPGNFSRIERYFLLTNLD